MRWRAATLLALLLVPTALGSAPHPTRGHLLLPEGAVLRGEASLEGGGLLELAPDAGVSVSFDRVVHGWLQERMRDNVHLGLPYPLESVSVTSPEEANRSLRVEGATRVENVACGPQCLVAAYTVGEAGALAAAGLLDGALAPATAPREVNTTQTQGSGPGSGFVHALPAGTLVLGHEDMRDARVRGVGAVVLVIADATFDLATGEGPQRVDVRWTEETTRDVGGQAVVVRHHARHAFLVLEAPTFGLAPGAGFRLSFPAGADARLDGVLAARGATGTLTVAGARHELDRDDVLLDGSMALRLRAGDEALLEPTRALAAGVDGDMARVVVAGADATPAVAPRAAAAGGGLVALLAAALLGRLVVAPLYHRLGPSDVLANANRRRIYEAIRARPGIGVGELVEAVGLSRILVRHHLHMLEAHKLVRATVWRRRRTYALVGDASGHAAAELKDPTRRTVAAALSRLGRATQKDLVEALGISQRLASYHLARLEAAGLVRVEGRNPRTYAATEELVRAVAREQKDAQEEGEGDAEGKGAAAAHTATAA